ncbi:Pkinase domain-containing protein [Rhizoctonia solani AG-1 IA]|uniref:Pkinase domain-containing protein n=1 Tax=Thanatephorus cucumeris (strain AG1-IA) TaxID=983506 RepID=L8WJP4_THACA|nr:Pkinase domain-containing protein [Rhizoctonia solani AG-1 IA]
MYCTIRGLSGESKDALLGAMLNLNSHFVQFALKDITAYGFALRLTGKATCYHIIASTNVTRVQRGFPRPWVSVAHTFNNGEMLLDNSHSCAIHDWHLPSDKTKVVHISKLETLIRGYKAAPQTKNPHSSIPFMGSYETGNVNEKDTIRRTMYIQSCDEILKLLQHHGCTNVTKRLDLGQCAQDPVSYGGFGDVYTGTLGDGLNVAMKCLRVTTRADGVETRSHLKRAAHEVYVWSKCKHSNVLELVGVAQYRSRIVMVSPWMKQGNLVTFLSKNPDVDKYCAQVAEGVAHLHGHGIVSLNTKVNPIDNGIPKLTDFGSAQIDWCTLEFTGSTKIQTTMSFSLPQAPEILKTRGNLKLTTATDVYSLGMVSHAALKLNSMAESSTDSLAITGSTPYSDYEGMVPTGKITEGLKPARPKKYLPKNYKQANVIWGLLTHCWELEPENRPSAIEVAGALHDVSTDINSEQSSNIGRPMGPEELQEFSTSGSEHESNNESEPGAPGQALDTPKSSPTKKRGRPLGSKNKQKIPQREGPQEEGLEENANNMDMGQGGTVPESSTRRGPGRPPGVKNKPKNPT